MEHVIVRTPETDRKRVSIPTLLADLTDYVDPATLACAGTGTTGADYTVTGTGPFALDNLAFTNLTHCDGDGATDLLPQVAGQFMLVAQATMSDTAPFSGKICAFSIGVNGVIIATLNADNTASAWSGSLTALHSLVVGDSVQIFASNPGGSAGLEDVTISATITIYRIGT